MKTTEQILSAPNRAIYVWPKQNTSFYLIKLLVHLNRSDLQVKYLSRFFNRGNEWRGTSRPVIIDHHCYEIATTQELDSIHEYKMWINLKEQLRKGQEL